MGRIRFKRGLVKPPLVDGELFIDKTNMTVVVKVDDNEVVLRNGSFSGSYDDLSSKPVIPEDISDLTDTTGLLTSGGGGTGNYNDLTNKPTIPTDVRELADSTGLLFSGSYDDLSGKPTIPTPNATAISYGGSTVAAALDSLLYVSPTVSLTGGSTNQKGSTVANVNLSWNINKTITSQSISGGIGSLTSSIRTHTLTGVNLTTDTSYTITVGDGVKNVSSTTSVVFRNTRNWGVSSSTTYNSALILGLSSELVESKAKSFTVTADTDQYIYYAYPSRLGAATFLVGGFEGGFSLAGTISHTNSSGYVENYYLYRSDNPSLGATTVIAS